MASSPCPYWTRPNQNVSRTESRFLVSSTVAVTPIWRASLVALRPASIVCHPPCGFLSALGCFIGAAILIGSRVGSWRIMLGVFAGSASSSLLLNAVGSETNPLFGVPFWWHIVLGGWAFGAVFMATDPVSAAHSNTGKYVYGFLIGLLAILIRVVNPAYPEGMMLAILFMNLFAALIDYYVVKANVKRRRARYAA